MEFIPLDLVPIIGSYCGYATYCGMKQIFYPHVSNEKLNPTVQYMRYLEDIGLPRGDLSKLLNFLMDRYHGIITGLSLMSAILEKPFASSDEMDIFFNLSPDMINIMEQELRQLFPYARKVYSEKIDYPGCVAISRILLRGFELNFLFVQAEPENFRDFVRKYSPLTIGRNIYYLDKGNHSCVEVNNLSGLLGKQETIYFETIALGQQKCVPRHHMSCLYAQIKKYTQYGIHISMNINQRTYSFPTIENYFVETMKTIGRFDHTYWSHFKELFFHFLRVHN